ncbi:hypothetical protein Misp01_62270 [Microtetraspora sp. NBRC 13810]|nr:hypothetical protein Misp01_62270 [Microtetraspora sp. NBRC 13810]
MRTALVAVVGWGALLCWSGPASADPPREDSQLAALVGADLGTVLRTLPAVFCGNRLINYRSPVTDSPTKCVNGPENSGNSSNSGNFHNSGAPINSGNFSNVNGSTHSNNSANADNMANGPQHYTVDR